MKKSIRFSVVLVVLMLLMSVFTLTKAQDVTVFKVAAVAPSAKNDLAFSQSMFDALTAIQTEMGADKFQFDFVEGVFNVDDAASALRDWASSGDYDLVIAHGSQYGSIIQELAPEFPDVSFAWGTDVNTFGLPNVYAYTAAAEEGGYINGAIAAEMSKSGIMGVIGPIEVGDAKAYIDGFKVGAAATKPDITVNVNYIQSFSDIPLATAAGKAFVDNKADVLTGSAQMVVGPIGVAKESKLLWFGTQSNQSELAGDAGVLFQVYHWEVILKEIIANIEEGTLGGESYTIDLENGGLVMESSPTYLATLSDDDKKAFQAKIDDYAAKIDSGEIVVLPKAEATPDAMEMTPEATAAS
ncbi:MAG: BMP family ABC transporter substrate-binding protein [Anaerolineaceae bacterium]|nr:BMP family ABC transporter substrate-binding protein [Anaerolineaceae bacterium]